MTSEPMNQARRPGAPAGNRHRADSGLRMGGWPPGTTREQSDVYAMRRRLRDAVQAAHGKVSEQHEQAINVACEHEKRRLLLARQIRRKANDWNEEQVDRYSAAEVAAAVNRAAIVTELLAKPKHEAPVPFSQRTAGPPTQSEHQT